jgi:excinuclease UvrABC ATPase subunit
MFDAIQPMIRIRCSECDGHGVYSIVNSMDPSAKLYECEQCGGDGFLEVEAEEIEA